MTEEEKRKEKEYLKQEAQKARREEWEKIRSLGTGAKIQYFWDYYKIVLVLAVVLITVIYIIVNMVIGFRTHVLLYTSILNVDELNPDIGRLTSDFAEYTGGIKKREKIEFDASIRLDPNSSGTSQADVANTMKMTALLQTGILDTCLAPGETMQFLQEQGMFMSLDDLLDEDLKAEYQDSGYLYYAPEPLYDEETGALILPQTEGDGEETSGSLAAADRPQHIYAVRVDQSGVLLRYGIHVADEVWFSVIGSCDHTEMAMRLFDFLSGKTG